MSTVHIAIDHAPTSNASGAYFALAAAFVIGTLGIVSALWAQRNQLKSDRKERDREILRLLLGEGAEALGLLGHTSLRLMRLWAQEIKQRNPRRVRVADEQRKASELALSVQDRLGLHLQADDPILGSYENAIAIRREIAAIFFEHGHVSDIGTHRIHVEELLFKLEDQRKAFVALSRKRVGPQ